jgi:hypothetical protein
VFYVLDFSRETELIENRYKELTDKVTETDKSQDLQGHSANWRQVEPPIWFYSKNRHPYDPGKAAVSI